MLANGAYSERDARAVFARLLGGVAHLHAAGVVHRDLKLENLVRGPLSRACARSWVGSPPSLRGVALLMVPRRSHPTPP